MYLFSPLQVLYTPHRGTVVAVSYEPAPLLRQLGLETERIIVFFSSKGVNHMAYLAHVATVVMLCATVCRTVMPSFSDKSDVSTIRHSFKTDRSRTPLFHIAQYGDYIIGPELNIKKLPGFTRGSAWPIKHLKSLRPPSVPLTVL